MTETNETVVTETEEAPAAPEVKEETAQEETKQFSDMTEEEQFALSDDDFVKGLEEEDAAAEEEGEKKTETPADDNEAAKSLEDKISDGDDVEYDELEKATPEQRGRYYALQKERGKTREALSELDKVKAIQDGQLKVIEKMRDSKTEDVSTQSEYAKARAVIADKAKAHEEETGEEYRLSARDFDAMETAKTKDYQVQVQRNAQATEIKEVDDITCRSIDSLKESLGEENDFDHVYQNIIEPLINPNIAQDPRAAMRNAKTLRGIAWSGGDPAAYAYHVLAKGSESGKKYFENKGKVKKNTEDIKKSTKEITKSTSQLDSTKTTTGKTAVTINDLAGEGFIELEKKLTSEQFMKVVGGETVYI